MHFVKWLKIQIDANLFITVSQLQVAFVCQQQFYISFFPPHVSTLGPWQSGSSLAQSIIHPWRYGNKYTYNIFILYISIDCI